MGVANVAREGKDVTIVAWSRIVHVALDAAKTLEKEGIDVEVIDLRSLRPLDTETILASVAKTHRAVIAGEGWPYGGVGAEIFDRIQRLAFDELDAPIERVQTIDVPMPYNAKLEQLVIPQATRDRRRGRTLALPRLIWLRARARPAKRVYRGDDHMAKVLEMPKLSPTMTEGQLTVWHKKEGDAVGVDDLLAEVETDKATMEFRSFDKGTLLKLLVPTGSQVLLGQPVAIIGIAGRRHLQARAAGSPRRRRQHPPLPLRRCRHPLPRSRSRRRSRRGTRSRRSPPPASAARAPAKTAACALLPTFARSRASATSTSAASRAPARTGASWRAISMGRARPPASPPRRTPSPPVPMPTRFARCR